MFAPMRNLFSQFSERSKLLLVVLAFSLLGIVLSLWLGGLVATSIVTIPTLISILQVTKGVWTPEGGSKSGVGLASLGVALAAAGLSSKWSPVIDAYLKPLIEKYPPLKDALPAEAPSVAVLLFLLAVIFVVNYLNRDKTAMKEHPTPLVKEFPERDYKDSLRLFKKALENDLNSLDMETNWNAAAFVPLDAEVEVQSGTKRLKKITDLLSAIRSDRRSSVFLVLGDPGSGKSVALRKLCRDLLEEVEPTGKVPLYINLKEWEPKEVWTEASPPTSEQVYKFVLDSLKARLNDVFSSNFLDKYFERMFETGRLFVVLDSFDEIPAVLDVSENSWLIDKLSDVLFKFLNGAHESRGILASRIFRRPTKKFDARTTLEIRPFTESKIAQTLKNYATYSETFLDLLFNQRPEFVPIARNPFTVALISDYARDNHNTLPANQAELYSSYILRRLKDCRERTEENGLTDEKVIECATDIADAMFTSEHLGLEASVHELQATLNDRPIEDVIDLLLYARLARVGKGHKRRFSFAHRRFNEYFVVQRLKQQPERVPTDSIPTDSRWRDALVLYCEVAEEAKAREIAEFCWAEVVKMADARLDMRDPQYLRSIQCLRFLKEAFRARVGCIEPFRDDLAAFISRYVSEGENLLAQKFAVETVGLLRPADIDATLTRALNLYNPWIDETALKSCHYLPSLSDELNKELMLFIDSIPPRAFLKRRKELMFSLKLSNVFSGLRKFCVWRVIDIYLLTLGTIILVVLEPSFTLITLLALRFFKNFDVVMRVGERAQARTRKRRFFAILANRATLAFAVIYPAFLLLMAPTTTTRLAWIPSPIARDAWGVTFTAFLGVGLAVPWYEFRYYARDLFAFLSAFRPKHLKWLLMMLLGYGAVIGLFFLLAQLVSQRVITTVILLFFAFMSAGLLVLLFRYARQCWRDYRRLARLQPDSVLTRQQIAEDFRQFKTESWRLKYVRFLRDVKVAQDSQWPDGAIPRVGNDEASTLLAKLEEGWLGLDR